MRKFKRLFRSLPDPRAPNSSHNLFETLFIALVATLCGAEGASDRAEFGKAKEALLRRILKLEHGIPSHDTFSRILRELDPRAFAQAFRRFLSAFAKVNGIDLTGVVAIDGKALRGAYELGASATPLHMVNVWAAGARMLPGTMQGAWPQRGFGRTGSAGPGLLHDVLALKGNQSAAIRYSSLARARPIADVASVSIRNATRGFPATGLRPEAAPEPKRPADVVV